MESNGSHSPPLRQFRVPVTSVSSGATLDIPLTALPKGLHMLFARVSASTADVSVTALGEAAG